MTERRYSDEEVAAIFDLASETQSGSLPAPGGGEGLTLAELKDIGREVGMAPTLIERAAHSLDVAGKTQGRTLLGLPIGVGHTVDLDRPLTDEQWQGLVVDLRETFDARGRLREDGGFRQWTNGNLEALLEPTSTGQRLRLRTLKGSALRLMRAGAIMLGVAGVLAVVSLARGDVLGTLPGLIFPLAIGVGMIGGSALRLPGWARLRRRQMQEIGERLALATASEPVEVPPSRTNGL